MNVAPKPMCVGCKCTPDQIEEYRELAAEERMSPNDYCRREEGTFNHENGHFLCTVCYVRAGMPTAPGGWRAP